MTWQAGITGRQTKNIYCNSALRLTFKPIILLLAALQLATPDISFSKELDDCNFYKTYSHPKSCSKYNESYTRTYGLKYCTIFKDKRANEWTGALKTWADQTSSCLQEMLTDNSSRVAPTCDQLKSFAFDSHPICYKQYGFCKLSFSERFQVLKVVQMADVANNFSDSVSQFLNVILKCASEMMSTNVKNFSNRVFFSTRDAPNEVKDYAIKLIESIPTDSKNVTEDYIGFIFPYLLFNKEFEGMRDATQYYNGVLDTNQFEVGAEETTGSNHNIKPFTASTPNRPKASVTSLVGVANDSYLRKANVEQFKKALNAGTTYRKKMHDMQHR